MARKRGIFLCLNLIWKRNGRRGREKGSSKAQKISNGLMRLGGPESEALERNSRRLSWEGILNK